MVVGVSWSGAAWVLPALGSYSSLREPWMPTCTVTYWSRAWSPPFRDWAAGQYSNMITTTTLLKKLRVKVMDWLSMSPDLNSIDPFHKTLMTRLTVISIVNPKSFLYIFFFMHFKFSFKSLFVVLHYLCIKLQNKIFILMWGCFLCSFYGKFASLLFWLPLSVSIVFFYWKSWKHYRRNCIELFKQNGNTKKYICGTLPFTALQVNRNCRLPAAEKPGNVKKGPLSICGASSNGRWRSTMSITSTSSVMSSWRSGRGLQWQPVKLWWTPCSRGLR